MTRSVTRKKPWEKGSVRIARRLFPVRAPRTAALRGVTDLGPPSAARVTVELLAAPDASGNLACHRPSAHSLPVKPAVSEAADLDDRLALRCPGSSDLSGWLLAALGEVPAVASLLDPLGFPGAQGKNYRADVRDGAVQLELFASEADQTEECVHGIKRAWCAICSGKESDQRARGKSAVVSSTNPLDLILPLLQPPLGADFDSGVSFAPGQRLLPFQPEGIRFLTEHRAALLGDEMGLGKSIQAIVALRILFRMGTIRDVILLCPKSVVYDWYDKFWEWAPELRVVRVRAARDERLQLWNSPAHVYITTYETWREDADRAVPHRFDGCILDEIQRIKNPETGVTRAARGIDARFRWGLSGTPLENKVEDVVSIFAYLKPGLLRTSDADKPRLVKERIEPYFLRRRASDVRDDLGEKVSHEVSVELSDSQRRAYDLAYAQARGLLKKDRTRMNALASITKLKQICNLDPVTGESCKVEYLLEKLEELQERGEKALVFSQYPNKTLRKLVPRLREYNPRIFDGSLSDQQRQALVHRFQRADDESVLLMSVRAAGLGVTLTEANHVFHFDMWWNPATAKQAEGRAYRIGQDKTVFVKTLYTVGTIEQRIREILRRKEALFTQVIDDLSVEDVAHRLTDEELFGLFDLERTRPSGSAGGEDRTVGRLRDLTPYEFEELIKQLYERMGYLVRLTPKSQDAGVDIYAKRMSDAGVDSRIIQCKHYVDGVVGVDAVRELYGVLQADQQAGVAVLVTSGRFSRPAQQFACGRTIDLVALPQLRGLLERYQLSETEGG